MVSTTRWSSVFDLHRIRIIFILCRFILSTISRNTLLAMSMFGTPGNRVHHLFRPFLTEGSATHFKFVDKPSKLSII